MIAALLLSTLVACLALSLSGRKEDTIRRHKRREKRGHTVVACRSFWIRRGAILMQQTCQRTLVGVTLWWQAQEPSSGAASTDHGFLFSRIHTT
jgi:hypothetical protein